MTAPVRLLDLPLGSWFRYIEIGSRDAYVLLDRSGCGLVCRAPSELTESGPFQGVAFQGVFAAADSSVKLDRLFVEPVAVAPVKAAKCARCGGQSVDACNEHACRWLEDAPKPDASTGAAGEPLRERLIGVIAEGLRGTLHCHRVWEAWSVGTMSEDDFSLVEESETPAELADAILAAFSLPAATTTQAPAAPTEPSPTDLCRELRTAVGLFAGAMACSPEEAWREAIERAKALSAREDQTVPRTLAQADEEDALGSPELDGMGS